MSDYARVDSIDVLRSFRAALWKFHESANVALADAESEMQRVLVWLDTEQHTHWRHQVRIRGDLVTSAKEKVRQKKLFKDSSGRMPTAIDEEKALAVALRRLAEAEEKLANTKKWSRRLQVELHNYKGGVQRLATAVVVDVPAAVARLDKLAATLERYAAIGPALATSGADSAGGSAAAAGRDGAPSMGRAERGPADATEEDVAGHPDFPKVESPQVVLRRTDAAAGDGTGAFVVCASADEAEQQAGARAAAEPGSHYAIYDPAGRVIHRVGADPATP